MENIVMRYASVTEGVNSHISVVHCSFFEFWAFSKWCIREWVNTGQKNTTKKPEFVSERVENCGTKEKMLETSPLPQGH